MSPRRSSRIWCANTRSVHRDEWLQRNGGVEKQGARITAFTTLSGKRYTGRMFIDATYEGDLMAAAGADYHVGREANSVYGETWNGVQTGVLHHRHHFGVLPHGISPYKIPGDPSSGVLPRISTEPPGVKGEGDRRIQAYCFRMCLTNDPANRVPFPKPEGYDPSQYELLLRIFDAGCARPSTSSTPSRTTRPTPTTTGRSAPTTSATTTITRRAPMNAAARSSRNTSATRRAGSTSSPTIPVQSSDPFMNPQPPKNWTSDLIASVVVFLVALPLCMGVAIASGVSPAMGLISGIIGGVLVGLLAGSPLQVSGPAAGLVVIVWDIIRDFGLEKLGLMIVVAGLIQIAGGLFRIGGWFRAVSPAVVNAMLAGIGVLIFASQFHVMVDDKPRASGVLNLLSIPEAIYKGVVPLDGSSHHVAAIVGLITIGALLAWSRSS